MVSFTRLCTDQMSRFRPVADLKAAYDLLQHAIGLRHALVLSKMLEPGVRQKGLDETAVLGGIFKYTPVISTVSAALACAPAERVQKRFAILRIDVVFNRHQNGSTVWLNRMSRDRGRPMH